MIELLRQAQRVLLLCILTSVYGLSQQPFKKIHLAHDFMFNLSIVSVGVYRCSMLCPTQKSNIITALLNREGDGRSLLAALVYLNDEWRGKTKNFGIKYHGIASILSARLCIGSTV